MDVIVQISLEGHPETVRRIKEVIEKETKPALVSGDKLGESRRTDGALSMRYATYVYHV